MARPRLNIEQDIIAAMHRAARHGYSVLRLWQIALWMDGVECTDVTIYFYLKKLEKKGKVRKYSQRKGYTLPDRKTLREEIAEAHAKLRDNSTSNVAEALGVHRQTVTRLKD